MRERTAAKRLAQSATLSPPALRGGARILAWVMWITAVVLAVLLFVAGLPVRYGNVITLAEITLPTGWSADDIRTSLGRLGLSVDLYAAFLLALPLTLAVGCLAVAAVIACRRAGDWLALFVALFLVTFGTGATGVISALGESRPAWHWPVQIHFAFLLIAFLAFCALFPDGRFVPRWTRQLTALWAVIALYGLLPLYGFLPVGRSNLPDWLWQALWLGFWATGLVAQIYRYRRVSGPVQRQQTKWVVVGVAGMFLGFVGFVVIVPALFASLSQPGLPGLLTFLIGSAAIVGSFLLIPLTLGVAILRYRLWDIDVIINRALVYGPLIAALALIYAGTIALLQQLFHALTGQGSQFAIVASTLAIAALSQPLRRRLQAFIDRRFYRRKYDAARIVAAFGTQLRDETDLERLSADLLAVVEETMQPAHVSLWLRPPDRGA